MINKQKNLFFKNQQKIYFCNKKREVVKGLAKDTDAFNLHFIYLIFL